MSSSRIPAGPGEQLLALEMDRELDRACEQMQVIRRADEAMGRIDVPASLFITTFGERVTSDEAMRGRISNESWDRLLGDTRN